ncbi:MAG: sulfotransferase family 2 domain-containing protein [Cyclobacteriaceae bacterium]|nr:sulfotransferase family 2 domain-containing protein [Cyclobacteriaceae bacterium]
MQLLIEQGRFQTDPLDFNHLRAQSLEHLKDYLPENYPLSTVPEKKRNPILFNLQATAAQIKSGYQTKGGHLVVPQQKLFYVRIPKAASTSLSHVMLGLIKPDLKSKSLNATQLNFLADAWMQTQCSTDLKSFTGFTVVRHPVSRLLSVYRDFFLSRESKPFIYQNYLGGILPQNLSFDEFVERIHRIPDRFKDQHFKPQHLFTHPYLQKGIPVQFFKLEDPEKLQAFLLPYNITLPHLNKTPESTPISYRESTINTIKKVYTFDFEVYGYDQNSGF